MGNWRAFQQIAFSAIATSPTRGTPSVLSRLVEHHATAGSEPPTWKMINLFVSGDLPRCCCFCHTWAVLGLAFLLLDGP